MSSSAIGVAKHILSSDLRGACIPLDGRGGGDYSSCETLLLRERSWKIIGGETFDDDEYNCEKDVLHSTEQPKQRFRDVSVLCVIRACEGGGGEGGRKES